MVRIACERYVWFQMIDAYLAACLIEEADGRGGPIASIGPYLHTAFTSVSYIQT